MHLYDHSMCLSQKEFDVKLDKSEANDRFHDLRVNLTKKAPCRNHLFSCDFYTFKCKNACLLQTTSVTLYYYEKFEYSFHTATMSIFHFGTINGK